MSQVSNDFKLLNHYTVFVYPFLHSLGEDNRNERVRTLGQSWVPWWSRLGDKVGAALDNTYFFLPYIREVLFPETLLLKDTPPGTKYENWIRSIEQWTNRGLSSFCQMLYDNSVLRLTYKQDLLNQIKQIVISDKGQRLSAGIEWIDAFLFPSRWGFLMLKLSLPGDAPTLSQLTDLNYHFRLVHAPNINWTLPQLALNGQAETLHVRDLLDFLTHPLVSDSESITDFTKWKANVATSNLKRTSETEAGQVYGERSHVFSYACVDLGESANEKSPSGVFSSLKDRLVFEFASSLTLGSSIDEVNTPMWIPTKEQAERLKANNQFSIWETWTGMALKESVVFLGTDDIKFNKVDLPANVEDDYLPLFIYSLYQKYKLFIFADQLMRKGAYVAQHLHEVRSLMDRFMDFRNKYWFNEVTRKPLGQELYSKFQHGLASASLFDLVSCQVKDLKEYYEERRQNRIATLLNVVTFIFLPIGATISTFSMGFVDGSWKALILALVVVLIISLGIWRWWTEDVGPSSKEES